MAYFESMTNVHVQTFFQFYFLLFFFLCFSPNFLFSHLCRIIIFNLIVRQLIKNNQFQLKSGEKYCILHGRKVDFTSCNFRVLSSLVQQTFNSVKIAYFPPL